MGVSSCQSDAVDVDQMRDRLFPGWRNYQNTRFADSALAPFYRVECASIDEYVLARQAKPPFVQAEITLSQRFH